MADFAARLNKLFETVHPPGRKPHTNAEVAAALTASGHPISKPYLSQLRSGQRTNPSDETVAALAKFFKVKPDYFFNDIYAAAADDILTEGVALNDGLEPVPALLAKTDETIAEVQVGAVRYAGSAQRLLEG